MKSLATLFLIVIVCLNIKGQYSIGWDTLFSSNTTSSSILSMKLDFDGNTYTSERIGNNFPFIHKLVKRNSNGQIVWQIDTNVSYQKFINLDNYGNPIINSNNYFPLIKLNATDGTQIQSYSPSVPGNNIGIYETYILANNDLLVIGYIISIGSTIIPYAARFDENGVLLWQNSYVTSTSSIFKKGIVKGNNLYCLAFGNDYWNPSFIFSIDLTTGNEIWQYSKPNDWHRISDFALNDDKIVFIGKGIRPIGGTDYFDLLYQIDLDGSNSKAIDSTIYTGNVTLGNYNKLVVDDNKNIYVVKRGETFNSPHTLFKFDFLGNKIDSIPTNIFTSLASSTGFFNADVHIHHNLIFIIGLKENINSYGEKAMAIYDINSNQITEIMDLNPSIFFHEDSWKLSSVNFQGAITLVGVQHPSDFSGQNARIIHYTRQDLSTQIIEKPTIRLYPNPSQNILYLSSNNLIQNQHLRIYNISGQVVFNRNIEKLSINEVIEIDVSFFAKGLYLIDFNNSKEKFIVD
jgi:hypothetical protein